MQVGPQSCAVQTLSCVQQVVMVVPVDADIHETQNVGQQNRNQAARLVPFGDFISKTMIVMMTARTPSLNASKRPLFISSRPSKTRNKLFFASNDTKSRWFTTSVQMWGIFGAPLLHGQPEEVNCNPYR